MHNISKRIYLPSTNAKGITLGEVWFLDSKFWKLQVMMGYSWSDLDITKRGFSFINLRIKDHIAKFIDKLKSMGIEFKTDISEAGWNYRVNISSKKKNLELIDKLYDEYYDKTIKEHAGWVRYNNYIVNEAFVSDPENIKDPEKIQRIV